jgi:hypothetical protein
MRAHLRSEVHRYLGRSWLTPGGAGERAQEEIEHRIDDAKRKLDK